MAKDENQAPENPQESIDHINIPEPQSQYIQNNDPLIGNITTKIKQ